MLASEAIHESLVDPALLSQDANLEGQDQGFATKSLDADTNATDPGLFDVDDLFDFGRAAGPSVEPLATPSCALVRLPFRRPLTKQSPFFIASTPYHHTQPDVHDEHISGSRYDRRDLKSLGSCTASSVNVHQTHENGNLSVGHDQPQYVNSSQLQLDPDNGPNPEHFGAPDYSNGTEVASNYQYHQNYVSSTTLHISQLPRSQRVETQMPITLTMWPLPKGVTKLQFPGYTMARSKLVTSLRQDYTPDTLQITAHCVCATAMQDPQKLAKAFHRAAEATDCADVDERFANAENIGKLNAGHEARPENGGFVFICGQCIGRENKRIGRKKCKDGAEEEKWLLDQPKRIIVFNKAQTLEFEPCRAREDETQQAAYPGLLGSEQFPAFPDDARQVQLPMRIQCYSRHHSERLGYRVIFTVRDWQGAIVAQKISSPCIITDDHKIHQSSKASPDSTTPYSKVDHIIGSDDGVSNPDYGMLDSPISKASPLHRDSMPLSNSVELKVKPKSRPTSTHGNPLSRSSSLKSLSRPASPSTTNESQSKRQKAGDMSRLRADLTMTSLAPNNTEMKVRRRQTSRRPASDVGSHRHHPMTSRAGPGGLATPPASVTTKGRMTRGDRTDGEALNDSSQRADPREASPGHTSIATSQALSNSQEQSPPISEESRSTSVITDPAPTKPHIFKITPAEGPKSGGTEVTCLGHFAADSIIWFGSHAATTIKAFGDAALLCLVPPAVQAGTVPVVIGSRTRDMMSQGEDRGLPSFRYIDDDEQEIIKQALHAIQRQFMRGSTETYDFARQIFSSIEARSTDHLDVHQNSSQTQRMNFDQGKDDRHSTALEDAIVESLEMIDLDDTPNNVDLNRSNTRGQTMLHMAVSLGFYRLVSALLARSAHADMRDVNGMTPLHVACLTEQIRIIRRLRAAGADPTLRSLNGLCVTDMSTSVEVHRAIEGKRTDGGGDGDGLHRRSIHIQESKLAHTRKGSSSITMPSAKVQKHNDERKVANQFNSQKEVPCSAGSSNAHPWLSLPAFRPFTSNSWTGRQDMTCRPENSDTRLDLFTVSPAMAAWRDQVSVQIHQLQQSVQRALPPMPALPTYQAYPVVKRISNLVPQRSQRNNSDENFSKLKDAEYHWWELLTGPSIAPPAYRDIYPSNEAPGLSWSDGAKVSDRSEDETHAHQPEKTLDQKTHDHVDFSKNMTVAEQEELRRAYARKVKRLRSDRNLFFIWIPLLLIVLFVMASNKLPALVIHSRRMYDGICHHLHRRWDSAKQDYRAPLTYKLQ